jgi:hypothetical protein
MQVDGYKTGCYNARCPGYVQVHPRYFLGEAFGPYNGDQIGADLTIALVINAHSYMAISPPTLILLMLINNN